MMISGNHEAYRYPYGISPRVKMGDTEIMKLNDGIPLDHNLTFYEAILLYGPAYDKTLPNPVYQAYGGWCNSRNFQKPNYDWFFTAFSPLADYIVTYGDQCLVCLEWGDDESWAESKVLGGGTLPRAGKGGTAQQIALGNVALSMPQAKKILCTHFTLVNYEPQIALSESGKVFPTDTYTLYDYGSAWGDRRTLYGDWLRQGRFNYALAGHAHRVGLYTCDYRPAVMGEGIYIEEAACLQTRGYLPDKIDLAYLGNRTKIVVSSSAGCMAKQNLSGELSGQGMDFPAATLLYFNGKEHIEIMKTNHPRAKPRFCVSCDYIDINCGGFWESFKAVGDDGTFELKPYWEKIHPKLGEVGVAKPEFINSVVLWIIENGETKPYDGTTTVSGNTFKVALPDTLPDTLKSRSKYIEALFLSIKFNGMAFKGLPGFDHYDFTSPWNIQIEIFNEVYEEGLQAIGQKPQLYSGLSGGYEVQRQLEALNKRKDANRLEDLAIRRHKKDGEVPSFIARVGLNSLEYKNDLDMPK